MTVKCDENDLKQGLLGLVVALVEIIQDLVERQAIRRIEGGRLSDEEIERLGTALIDLDEAIETIKRDNDLEDVVDSVIGGLDEVADDLLNKFWNAESWAEEMERV
ncbi:MAG TPA: gas vesicle protein K [Methanotrichaceae archaeon]|nr:gas vesicle protein K [Methanotrichaceae archaeon]